MCELQAMWATLPELSVLLAVCVLGWLLLYWRSGWRRRSFDVWCLVSVALLFVWLFGFKH